MNEKECQFVTKHKSCKETKFVTKHKLKIGNQLVLLRFKHKLKFIFAFSFLPKKFIFFDLFDFLIFNYESICWLVIHTLTHIHLFSLISLSFFKHCRLQVLRLCLPAQLHLYRALYLCLHSPFLILGHHTQLTSSHMAPITPQFTCLQCINF